MLRVISPANIIIPAGINFLVFPSITPNLPTKINAIAPAQYLPKLAATNARETWLGLLP